MPTPLAPYANSALSAYAHSAISLPPLPTHTPSPHHPISNSAIILPALLVPAYAPATGACPVLTP
eukprot:699037-Rhodomonas_salina.1